jgi:hypothetical protein
MPSLPIGYRLEILAGNDVTPETESERQRLAEAASKFGTEEWDGNPLRLPGTRCPVPTEVRSERPMHRCGGRFSCGPVSCPVCRTELFPIFRLDMSDPKVAEIIDWPSPTLELPVCPGCILLHDDYHVDFSQSPFSISSKHLPAQEKPFTEIVVPYETRDVKLRPLEPHEYPDEEEWCDVEDHQIGGVPPRWYSDYKDNECPKCQQDMKYAAVIHYDDENVPLFEKFARKIDRSQTEEVQRPVAFCLGDCKSYYVFTCRECLVLTYRFVM